MAAVAKRLVLGCAAATQRESRVFSNDPAVLVDDSDRAADEERAVRPRLDRRDRLRLFLRAAVESAVAERTGRARFDGGRDRVCIGSLDCNPRPRLCVEDLR